MYQEFLDAAREILSKPELILMTLGIPLLGGFLIALATATPRAFRDGGGLPMLIAVIVCLRGSIVIGIVSALLPEPFCYAGGLIALGLLSFGVSAFLLNRG